MCRFGQQPVKLCPDFSQGNDNIGKARGEGGQGRRKKRLDNKLFCDPHFFKTKKRRNQQQKNWQKILLTELEKNIILKLYLIVKAWVLL